MNDKKRSLDYTWVIIIICFFMELICLGFCSSNKSLYLNAITEALGIKRGLFSINDSCRYVSTAIINLFFGTLVHKFGSKKMIMFGFLALIASMLTYSYGTNIFVFYIGGCLLGIGLAFTTTTMISSIIKRWCRTNTGKILGFVLAANGLGGAIAAQIVTPIIYEEGNPFGYRNAYRLVALILLVLAVVVFIFFKDKQTDIPAKKVPKKRSRGEGWVGMDFAAAKKRPYFYLTIFCVFITGMTLQGSTGIYASHMKDVGLDAAHIATILSVHSLCLTAFKFLAGVSYDRFGLRVTTLICDITAVIVTFMLSLITNSPIGLIIAFIYGIFSSLALPLETIMIPLITGDIFGNKSFDRLLGLMMAFNQLGYAVGAPVTNVCYDAFGTYNPIFYIFSFLMLTVTVMLQFIISASNKDRKKIETENAG